VDGAAQRDLVERYLAAYNAFDVDGMLAVLAPAVRFAHYRGEVLCVATAGQDAFGQLALQALDWFAARAQRVTAWQARADGLVATIAWRATVGAGMPDGPPPGTVLELTVTSEFTFAAGQIASLVDRARARRRRLPRWWTKKSPPACRTPAGLVFQGTTQNW
jgi:hypothetical protein